MELRRFLAANSRGRLVIPLDSPKWAELRHAYGSAADIPPLIRAIAAEPGVEGSSEGPWFELWSALCHQGDVYSASFAAVPHVIDILSENLQVACFDFFLLPTAIDVARVKRGVRVSEPLRFVYEQSLARLPSLVPGVSIRPWDATFCRSVLAATAVGKRQHALAELLIEIEESDIPKVLGWYQSAR